MCRRKIIKIIEQNEEDFYSSRYYLIIFNLQLKFFHENIFAAKVELNQR